MAQANLHTDEYMCHNCIHDQSYRASVDKYVRICEVVTDQAREKYEVDITCPFLALVEEIDKQVYITEDGVFKEIEEDMAGKASREKGKRGERELARALSDYGFDARRGQQYCGANGDADVVGLPGIHIECKRTERLSLYDALSQAKADAAPDEKPVVIHRKNNSEWVVVQPLEDWIDMYREWRLDMDFE